MEPAVRTDRTIANNKLHIIIHCNKKGTSMSIDVVIRGDRNVITRQVLLTNETRTDWAKNDLYRRRRFGEAGSPVTRYHHDSPKPVTKGRNNGIRMGDHGRTESLNFTFIDNVLYLIRLIKNTDFCAPKISSSRTVLVSVGGAFRKATWH